MFFRPKFASNLWYEKIFRYYTIFHSIHRKKDLEKNQYLNILPNNFMIGQKEENFCIRLCQFRDSRYSTIIFWIKSGLIGLFLEEYFL